MVRKQKLRHTAKRADVGLDVWLANAEHAARMAVGRAEAIERELLLQRQLAGRLAIGLEQLMAFIEWAGEPVAAPADDQVARVAAPWHCRILFSCDVPFEVELARMIRAAHSDPLFQQILERRSNNGQQPNQAERHDDGPSRGTESVDVEAPARDTSASSSIDRAAADD